jgi:hypothetical protein
MIERPFSYFRARQERAEGADRLGATDISRVAVIEVDGVDDLEHRPFPRQMALAFGDGRPGLAWLIAPESTWALSGRTPRDVGLTLLGHGTHPLQIASEIGAQISSSRLYSRHPEDTTDWLALFFQAAMMPTRFSIRDVRDLTTPFGTSLYDLPGPELRCIDRATALLHRDATHASADAARTIQHVRAIRALRLERELTLAHEAEAKRPAASAEAGRSP